MKTPILRYTPDQHKAIAILSIQPLTKEELFSHFPHLSHKEKVAMIRNPREMGKIILNGCGKYEVYSPPSAGLVASQSSPQPYSPPLKYQPLYHLGKSKSEKY